MATKPASTFSLLDINFKSIARSSDIQFALVLISIIGVMFVPLPSLILDFLLTISISLSFLILLISIYVGEALQFSSFPTLLLITTLFRLSLNVATTRSILLNGARGEVSSVVEAFGNFVVGGNYFVGFVIFTILVIINFMVITKGAGRVAEVAARFTLDAMPGKQMSIDAERSSGAIDNEEAKRRRKKIEEEADFYGAMDGASKFVRGDAIAGIIITAINIIVGLIIGVVSHNMTFRQAAETYTLLTVGDGLVSQIPAIIISVAAGIIVTRASGEGGVSDKISGQVFLHPKAFYMSSALTGLMAIVPGLPFVPFGILSTAFFFMGRYSQNKILTKQIKEKAAVEDKVKSENKETLDSLLIVDTLALEVGVSLVPLVDRDQNGEVLERIVSARRTFAQELGIIVPMVMVRDNIQLSREEYQILLKGNRVAFGSLFPDMELAISPDQSAESIEGIAAKDPAYGLPAVWINPSQRDEASFRGYTVVNNATVIVTHLTKIITEHAKDLIGRQEVQILLDGIKRKNPKVVEEILSSDGIPLGDVVKILQNILAEGIPIKDLLSICEAIADHCRHIKHPDILTRYVRIALGRTIVGKYLDSERTLNFIALDRSVEDILIANIQVHSDGTTSLTARPQILHKLIQNTAEAISKFQSTGTEPVLVVGAQTRWELHKLFHNRIPGLVVLASDELIGDFKRKNLGIVTVE